ncbi:MAG TPA: DUF4760 domain-containing protein [Candidatus Eremiobacteraceae bacterium]|nr:DUF4760 domain-containing protein [Candidatus Eremiobacteraceae bacterium]
MSLEVLNTFGTLTTVLVIAATAIAALVQLRHMRAGNQITAMLTIGEVLDAKRFQDAAAEVNVLPAAIQDPAFREYHVAVSRGQIPQNATAEFVALRQALLLVGNSYEELGVLIKRNIVDREIFLDRYSWVILSRWTQMAPFIALTREATGANAIWENFEFLAVTSEDWMKANTGGTYPAGVRRMQIKNPWPLPAAANA